MDFLSHFLNFFLDMLGSLIWFENPFSVLFYLALCISLVYMLFGVLR